MTHRIEQLALDGGEMDVHVWSPEAGAGPGVVVIQEIFGVGAHVHSVAERLSAAGYTVAAPDVFWRFAPGWVREADEAGTAESMEMVAQLDVAQAIADCGSTLGWLAEQTGGACGVLGFCLGGTLAYGVAAEFEPSACVSYYGSGVPSMLDRLDAITCPTLFHFGSLDPYIPGSGVEAIAEAIAGKDRFTLNVEIAGHAFDNQSPMFHDEAAARAAWSKTMAFLGEHLAAG